MAKPAQSKGIKKEKLATNPGKASTAHKAQDAAKKVKKTANKENGTASVATAQQKAKPSLQKKKDTNLQRASSPDIDALKVRIKELKEAAQKVVETPKKKRITQPDGTAGEDYNLQTAMGLGGDDKTYMAIRRGVCSILDKSGLDYRVRCDRQPVNTIANIFKVACQRFPYLENFVQDWLTKEGAKSRLKNRQAYCRKQGYDMTDFGMAAGSPPAISSDDENDQDGEDDDMGDGSGGTGEGDGGDSNDDDNE